MAELGIHTKAEIGRQPALLTDSINQLSGMHGIMDEAIRFNPEQIIFMGCGTSYYLAASAASYFLEYNPVPAIFIASYELYFNPEKYLKGKRTLLIPFTRNARTTETQNAVKKARTYRNVKSLAISCDDYAKTYNDYTLFLEGVQENSIVMTSTATTMLAAAMYFSLYAGKQTETLHRMEISYNTPFDGMPGIIKQAEEIAGREKNKTMMVTLGQGEYFGLAGEASIKVKEMVLLPTEVYYTMEYRHGPISIAGKDTFFMLFVSEKTKEHDKAIAGELKDLGASILGISALEQDDIPCDYWIRIPKEEQFVYPFAMIPFQYLGCFWAVAKGINPDEPRNLVKAVILP